MGFGISPVGVGHGANKTGHKKQAQPQVSVSQGANVLGSALSFVFPAIAPVVGIITGILGFIGGLFGS